MLTTDYTDYTDSPYPCNPCNPWLKFFAACEQCRLLQCREKMLGKVSLSALFVSRRLIGPLERNRRPRMTFGPLRTTDFRLRRAALCASRRFLCARHRCVDPLFFCQLFRPRCGSAALGLSAALRFTPFVKQPAKPGSKPSAGEWRRRRNHGRCAGGDTGIAAPAPPRHPDGPGPRAHRS